MYVWHDDDDDDEILKVETCNSVYNKTQNGNRKI